MKSPFKFLDAYGIKDKDDFFGRDKEVDTLYSMLFKTPIVLLYGLSGTGKSSIIQCGLANRFDGPDWLPFFIRREKDINSTLFKILLDASDESELKELPKIITALFDEYLRPIYLIFDQFEELFILGSEEEQSKFALNLKQLLDRKLPCKVLLVIREEYLGQLYPMEKEIPSLFDYRLRIEPMNNSKVHEVLEKSFTSFNITLESPANELRQSIIDNVSSGKSGIQLPFLQVYLDMLYREDYKREYGDKILQMDKNPLLEFTHQEVMEFGKIENVLDKFLREQTTLIQIDLQSIYPTLPNNAVQAVLDVFVTEDGTKRPILISLKDGILLPEVSFISLLPKLTPQALSDCLFKLEDSRLLRISDKTAELAHDSLASLIDQQRTDEQRKLNEVKRRVASAYLEKVKTGVWLTEGQILSMEDLLPKIKLDEHLEKFLDENRVKINEEKDAKEREKKIKLDEAEKQAQLEKSLREKAQSNEKRAKKITKLAIALSILALLSMGFALKSSYTAKEATDKEILAKNAAIIAQKDANKKLLDALTEKQRRLENELGSSKRALEVYRKADHKELINGTNGEIQRLEKEIETVEIEITKIK